MTQRQAIVSAATVVVATLFALGAMWRMSNGMVLPQRIFLVSTWWRAMKRTAILTAAVALASMIAAGTDIAGAVVVLGGMVVGVEGILMSYAKTFGPKKR